MVKDVLTAARARDNSSVGRQNGKVAAKGQGKELLDLLTQTKDLHDLLALKLFELAAMYARAGARDGHAYAISIANKPGLWVSEAEARNWIRLGEIMLKRAAEV